MDASAYAAIPRIVLDNGSGYIKFGLCSNKKAPHVIPNCVGQVKRKFGSQYYNEASSNTDQSTNYNDSTYDAHSQSFISENCYALMEYFCMRPHMNGLLYDPNRQRVIWSKLLSKQTTSQTGNTAGNVFGVAPESSALCITEPNLCPIQSKQALAEIIFEDFGFPLAAFITSQASSAYYYQIATNLISTNKVSNEINLNVYPGELTSCNFSKGKQCCLVVDCGFSASHSVPYVNGEPIQCAALRTALAGTQLNAYLKNITGLRSINLDFNELVVQHMKEEACYISSNFDLELKAAKKLSRIPDNTLLHHYYLLPNYATKSRVQLIKHFSNYLNPTPPLLNEDNEHIIRDLANGNNKSQIQSIMQLNSENTYDKSLIEKAAENNQVVDMFTERFSVPEILFSPQDIKLKECSIVELVYRSISLCPAPLQPHMASNIFLCGGTTKIPGFTRRFYKELRSLLPEEWDIRLYSSEDPSLSAFYGARLWTNDDSLFLSNAVTRNRYFENGNVIINTDDMDDIIKTL